jgi:hypothetical protein
MLRLYECTLVFLHTGTHLCFFIVHLKACFAVLLIIQFNFSYKKCFFFACELNLSDVFFFVTAILLNVAN